MKLLGQEVSTQLLMDVITERLGVRGIPVEDAPIRMDGVEPRVDPLAFNLEALAEHADPTRELPFETHRGGLGGRAVMLAKRAFRLGGQVFINEALGRQHLFNGHVRDSYAQLSAEVKRLRARLEVIETSELPLHPERSRGKGATSALVELQPDRAMAATFTPASPDVSFAIAATLKPPSASSQTSKPPMAKAPSAKPPSAKPSSAKPSSAKPSSAKPTNAKPTNAKPTNAKPSNPKPSNPKPSSAKASNPKPSNAEQPTPKLRTRS